MKWVFMYCTKGSLSNREGKKAMMMGRMLKKKKKKNTENGL
jgi:hypothetical protein